MYSDPYIPSDNEIRIQLKRLLNSAELKGSARMSGFISYVVKKTLKGEQDDIKGYSLGIDVFNKPTDFNPDTDASVRVEASRLRKALRLYYLSAGAKDPVLIEMPKGSYRVVFSYNKAAKETPIKPLPISHGVQTPHVLSVIKQHKIAFLAGCSFVLLICVAFFSLRLFIIDIW